MAILQDGRAFKSNGDVYLVVQGDEINISRLMASENSLSDAYDDAHHVPVEEVAAMLDIPVDSIFDFDAINIDAIVQDVLHHETSAIKIATERGYGMASHDGGRRWDRLIIRCGNANCPLNEPALAEFWMGEHGLERPKIFQYWVPGTGRHYQEYNTVLMLALAVRETTLLHWIRRLRCLMKFGMCWVTQWHWKHFTVSFLA